jgi:hypothetical protein
MRRYAAVVAVVLMMGTSPLHAQEAIYTVTMTSADVHKAPSTGSAVIGRAPRGKTFPVMRSLGSWVSIAWPDAETGIAYLHVAWGRISRGADLEALRISGSGLQQNAGAPSESERLTQVASTTAASQGQVRVLPEPRVAARPRAALSLPSHLVGIGGRISRPASGLAIAGRGWTYGALGAQIEAGRTTYTSLVGAGQLQTMQLAPSIMYSLPDLVTNAVWVRPYAGAGLTINRSTLRGAVDVPVAARSGLGSQILSGAELTWARLPQFAVSADLRQQWAPPTFDGFELGGFAVSMSAHWYVK